MTTRGSGCHPSPEKGIALTHGARSPLLFGMPGADKRKQSLYFPEDMLQEIQQEAARLDRSLSWIVQQGWKRARAQIQAFPSSNDDAESLADPREE